MVFPGGKRRHGRRGGERGQKNALLRRPGEGPDVSRSGAGNARKGWEGCRRTPQPSRFSRVWRYGGDLIGELLADEAEGRAEQHEAGANQEDLQSDIHKNSLSFVRAGRHAGRGAGRGASSAYPCGCASLTHGRCALNADPDCRNDYKEIRWRGGAPGRGSMPRISASRGRRRSAHESVLSERVQSG